MVTIGTKSITWMLGFNCCKSPASFSLSKTPDGTNIVLWYSSPIPLNYQASIMPILLPRKKTEGSVPPVVDPYVARLNVSIAIVDVFTWSLKISCISSVEMTTPSLNPPGYSTVSMVFPLRPKTPATSLVTGLPFTT